MATLNALSLLYAGQQIIMYGGIFVLVSGVIGSVLNTIVFLSLRTFRQSSCVFYLNVMSVLNIGQLLTNVLPTILSTRYHSDGTEMSLAYCKLRLALVIFCAILSLTCFCLVTIDQYCATCSRPVLHKFSSIKIARCLVILFSILWLLHSIPYTIFFTHVTSSITGAVTCTMTNVFFLQYRAYFVIPVLSGCLPISITVLFGLLAYYNVNHMSYYTVPLVRRELDKQLTTIVLVQVIVNFFVLVPYSTMNLLSLSTSINNNADVQAHIQLALNISYIIYGFYYASPFYIYICVSKRFRRQFMYVFFQIYLERYRPRPRIMINQVEPQAQIQIIETKL